MSKLKIGNMTVHITPDEKGRLPALDMLLYAAEAIRTSDNNYLELPNQEAEKLFEQMFDRFVPPSGPADTVAGEIVRAVNRILYRHWNDGDRIGIGYGKETCNPAARYLRRVCEDTIVEKAVKFLWGLANDDMYEKGTYDLIRAMLHHLSQHPELFVTKSSLNMWDCTDPKEDVDDSADDLPWNDEDDV